MAERTPAGPEAYATARAPVNWRKELEESDRLVADLVSDLSYADEDIRRLQDAVRDLLDELGDQGVDTVDHKARRLV